MSNKKSRFMKRINGILNYFKDVKLELKRVVWPTRKQVIQNTATVLVVCLLVGSIIWFGDWVFSFLPKLIVGE